MKYSLAIKTLVSSGALLLGCSSDVEAPPPIDTVPSGGTGGTASVGNAGGNAPIDNTGGSTPIDNTGGSTPIDNTGGSTPIDNTGGSTPIDNTGGTDSGGAGGGTNPPALTLADLVGKLDGHLVQTPCGDEPGTDDCAGGGWVSNAVQGDPGCQGGKLTADIEFEIGGDPGQAYDVNMHFYGVMEPRQYGNVATRAQQARPAQEPGGAISFASMEPGAGNYLSTGDNNYNTYEMHVFDQNDQEQMIYFFNADTATGHWTMAISYERPIRLIGGGSVQLRVFDNNCRQIKNCGPGGWPCADKARSVDISAANPQPANFQQPGLGRDPAHSGQWWLIDVLDFTPAQ